MRTALAARDAPLMAAAAAITAVTFPPVAAFAWLFTPFIFGALVACSHRLRTAVARHLRLCLTAGWIGVDRPRRPGVGSDLARYGDWRGGLPAGRAHGR